MSIGLVIFLMIVFSYRLWNEITYKPLVTLKNNTKRAWFDTRTKLFLVNNSATLFIYDEAKLLEIRIQKLHDVDIGFKD